MGHFARQRLKPRGHVDGRSDDGEIKAVGRTDVAIHDVAHMQRDAKGERWRAGGFTFGVERLDIVGYLERGGQRAVVNPALVNLWLSTGSAIASKYWLRSAIRLSRGMVSASMARFARSQNQMTALMVSPDPRRISPRRMRAPASRP